MTTVEGSLPKTAHTSNWNVLRSKSVPSGASGSHAVARSTPSDASDATMQEKDDLTASKQRRRPLKEFHPIDPVGLKH